MNLNIKNIFQLALTFHQEGKLDEAIIHYKKALEIKPDLSEAHNNLGVIFQSRNKLNEAENSFRKALEISPNQVDAHNNLGSILFKLNKLEDAEKSYKKAIELKPIYSEAYVNLAVVQQELDKFDEAIISYKKAKDLNSNIVEPYINFSYRLNDLMKLDKIINLNPNITKASLLNNKNNYSSNLKFSSPNPLEYEEFYRKGMGTENVGSFLRSLVQMVRPNTILEIGAGYTSPFLLEGLINNERVFHDGNLDESFFQDYNYKPKLVIIDDMSHGELKNQSGMNNLLDSNYVDFIEGKFEDKADILHKKYNKFDFVWFDCGGDLQFEIFIERYWHLCSGYVIFHYTYSDGKPNKKYDILINKIKNSFPFFDIIEPHKKRQGSITLVNKLLSKK